MGLGRRRVAAPQRGVTVLLLVLSLLSELLSSRAWLVWRRVSEAVSVLYRIQRGKLWLRLRLRLLNFGQTITT